jgi:hypothetical protein
MADRRRPIETKSLNRHSLHAVVKRRTTTNKMKLLKRIWRVMFPSHPLPCSHKWKRDGELYVKCDKCGELAVYVGGQR